MNTTDIDIYCNQILNDKIKVKKVEETENVLAFFHTKPYWLVHVVVIPQKHISSSLAYCFWKTSLN